MASFDPETGARIPPPGRARDRSRLLPANPWHRALAGVWIAALVLAVLLGAAGLAAVSPETGSGFTTDALAPSALSAAGWFLTIAVVAGIAQLAALAATWRAPEA